MATFYGGVYPDDKGETTHRLARRDLQTIAASWEGAVTASLWKNEAGAVMADVRLMPWQGGGKQAGLYYGPVNPEGVIVSAHERGVEPGQVLEEIVDLIRGRQDDPDVFAEVCELLATAGHPIE